MSGHLRTETQRVLACAVAGVAVGTVTVVAAGWQLGVLLGWLSTATLFLALTATVVLRADAEQTRALATAEDPSRTQARALVVSASTISIVAVLFGLHRAHQVSPGLEVALRVAALSTVFISWATVHTVFTLRYAHLYYNDEPGGIEFPGGEAPDFRDFLYVAFGIGMTFQVADTNVTSRAIRRSMLAHMMFAYVFATVIVAVSINVVAGLV